MENKINANENPLDKLDKMFAELNNSNNKGEKKMENISTSNLNIEIGELQVKGITLKGLKAHGELSVTDENVKVQCDAVMRMLGTLLDEFGSHLCNMMEVNTKRQERRMEAEAEYDKVRIKREQAQIDMYEAECEKAKRETAKTNAEIEKIKAETEAIMNGTNK